MSHATDGSVDRSQMSGAEIEALSERYQVNPMGHDPLVIAKASGVRITDADGREYLDAISGEWVVNLGFRHPDIVEAAVEQIQRAEWTAPMYNSVPRALLAQKVAEVAPPGPVSYTHLRAHETGRNLVC